MNIDYGESEERPYRYAMNNSMQYSILSQSDNPRSRAARRATSPSINTDKSLKDAPRPSDTNPVLAPYRGAGIQKKQKKKPLSHGQRVRHAKGLARGEAIQDRHAVKVADAKKRSRKVDLRRSLWEDINTTTKDETRKAIKGPGRFGALDEDDEDAVGEVQPFHGDTEIKVIDGVLVPAFASGQTMTMSLPPDDKHTEQELQVSFEPGKPKLDEASVQRASEEIPSTSDALPKQPEESGKSSAWIFWSRGKAADTKSLDETPLKGEIAIANTETESQPRRASLGLKKDAKPVSITTNASEAASSSANDKKITRTSGEIDSSKTIDPNSTPKTTKIESKGAAATAIAPVKQQELRPASPAPSKKAYEHLLLPPFEGTLKLPENLTWMEQLTRLIYGTKEPDFKHLNLVKDPPRIRNALAIGVHGYFPAPLIRSVLGQPTGTSVKFADMAAKSIQRWTRDRGYECQVKSAALEGEGKISERIDLLWKLLLNWIDEIRKSDFVMIACHSQGVPVATMLVAKLIHFGCIASSTRVGICAMAGVNMGPFPEFKSRWISGSAAELFEFSDADSKVSTDYRNALEDVLKFGVRITYVGSIDDQLVSLESSVFAPISHPHIYRAVSIDSRMHAPSFLSHLVAFALKLRNLGVQDHGLIRELSGPLAGSLYSGDGHSRLYEDPGIYDLAVSFTLETTSMPGVSVTQRVASSSTGNPFILPFAMRGMLEEDYVKSDLQEEAEELLKEFDEWKPTTKALKDVKWRLEGIRSRL